MDAPGGDDGEGRPALSYWLGAAPAHALSVVACAMLFFMMALTFVDVGGRYLFASPLPAAYEIISLSMPAIIFCALPLTNLREGHVTVDLLDTVVPGRLKRLQAVTANLIATAAMGLIAWRLGVRSYDHMRFQEVTDELWLPYWPFSAAMAALCAVATLACVVNVVRYAAGPRGAGPGGSW